MDNKKNKSKAKIQLAINCAMDACNVLSMKECLMKETRENLKKYAQMLREANDELKNL